MKSSSILLIAVLISLISGCHTVQGVGKDVQAGGRTIQRAAS